jgi:DNA-binding response OmpR family regulator
MNGDSTEASSDELAAARKHGVLLVDDDEDVRDVLTISLQHAGFSVWAAADGREALDLFCRHREGIDLVLLDVRMPRLDGPQTWAALREMNARLRCCFMSGHVGGYTVEQLRDMGAEDVFLKPFHPADLARALSALMNNRQPVAEDPFEVTITESMESMETEHHDASRCADEIEKKTERWRDCS